MSSSLTYGYTFDTTGSVIQRHHIGGATYADYATCYDAFGAQLGSYNNGGFVANTQDAVGWAGQWGGYTDQATAAFGSGSSPIIRYPLVLLGHRYYDPGAGRFLNRDPEGMEGGINLYAYCTNNPVNKSDPSGLNAVTMFTPEQLKEWGGLYFENSTAVNETALNAAKGVAAIAGTGGTLTTASALLGTGAGATVLAATGVVAVGAVGAYVGYNYVGLPLANALYGPGTYPTFGPSNISATILGRIRSFQFASPALLEQHFLDHVMGANNKPIDYPGWSRAQYLNRVQRIASGHSRGFESHLRRNGDTVMYNRATNEFVVKRGQIIKTLYKPERGLAYWLHQLTL